MGLIGMRRMEETCLICARSTVGMRGASYAIGTAGMADGGGGFNDRLDRPADCRKTASSTDSWWDPMAVSA